MVYLAAEWLLTVLILVHGLQVLLVWLVVQLISLILACIGRTGSILARLCCDRLSLVCLAECSLISSLAFDCSLLGMEIIGRVIVTLFLRLVRWSWLCVGRLDACADRIWNSVSSFESDHNTKIICRKCLLLAYIVLVYGYSADYGSAVAVFWLFSTVRWLQYEYLALVQLWSFLHFCYGLIANAVQ